MYSYVSRFEWRDTAQLQQGSTEQDQIDALDIPGWYRQEVKDGVDSATDTLNDSQKCRDLFKDSYVVNTFFGGDPAKFLKAMQEGNLIGWGAQSPNGTPFSSPNVGAVTSPGTGALLINGVRFSNPTITINSGGFYFNPYVTVNGTLTAVQNVPNAGFNGLSAQQVQAAVILHELAHAAGIFGADSGPGISSDASQANSRKIREACF